MFKYVVFYILYAMNEGKRGRRGEPGNAGEFLLRMHREYLRALREKRLREALGRARNGFPERKA